MDRNIQDACWNRFPVSGSWYRNSYCRRVLWPSQCTTRLVNLFYCVDLANPSPKGSCRTPKGDWGQQRSVTFSNVRMLKRHSWLWLGDAPAACFVDEAAFVQRRFWTECKCVSSCTHHRKTNTFQSLVSSFPSQGQNMCFDYDASSGKPTLLLSYAFSILMIRAGGWLLSSCDKTGQGSKFQRWSLVLSSEW